MDKIRSDPGSFKDPDGGILYLGERVYRYFTPESSGKFRALNESGLLDVLTQKQLLIGSKPVSETTAQKLRPAAPEGSLFIEHPRIPLVSYCYEWSFHMLRAAALTYLEVQQTALEYGFVLKDATPYNVQFLGTKPILIDVASFEPYRDGEPWVAYSEFCRLFLNPLYLQALTTVGFQPWLRGSIQGIYPKDLSRLISWRRKLKPNVFINVALQAWLESRFSKPGDISKIVSKPKVSKQHTGRLVSRLRGTVKGLKPQKRMSNWARYDEENTYSNEARMAKEEFVEKVLAGSNPGIVWDVGCNVGTFSLLAAKYARHVIAMDQDPDVIDILFERARAIDANVLPLVVDVLDPSPERGWAQVERRGILERGPADMVLALALTHHLAVAGNIPLPSIMTWLAKVGKAAIIEFVPKDDPAFQSMLRWREDIYSSYSRQAFEEAMNQHFEIAEQCDVSSSGRILYSVIRRSGQAG